MLNYSPKILTSKCEAASRSARFSRGWAFRQKGPIVFPVHFYEIHSRFRNLKIKEILWNSSPKTSFFFLSLPKNKASYFFSIVICLDFDFIKQIFDKDCRQSSKKSQGKKKTKKKSNRNHVLFDFKPKSLENQKGKKKIKRVFGCVYASKSSVIHWK